MMEREAFVGFWVYLGQERGIGEPRRTNESVVDQVARSQVVIHQARTARGDLPEQPEPLLNEGQRTPAANADLTQKIAGALLCTQLIPDVSEIGLVANQGIDTTQGMFAWCGKMTSLDAKTLTRITETIATDPRNRAASEAYANYLAGSVLDALR
ncbi:MAG: hypothetical protein M1358_14870 [Chloroflexi bacterium]|nr:hypothetical protein [Chloroflexota bacterium]